MSKTTTITQRIKFKQTHQVSFSSAVYSTYGIFSPLLNKSILKKNEKTTKKSTRDSFHLHYSAIWGILIQVITSIIFSDSYGSGKQRLLRGNLES